ncbi:MAG TPA: hypothetical protein VF316_09815, partial [Polyangiaceae bacterium]
MKRMLELLLVAVTVSACGATEYAFVPANGPTASLDGRPAAGYSIGAQPPTGDLRVASYGVEELGPNDASGQGVAALHIRVLVTNPGPQGWTLDTREQGMSLQGRGSSTPAFATASPGDGSPPVLTIAPQATRIVDLFFPLPADAQSPGSIPAFETTTRFHVGAALVAQVTPFARIETDEVGTYEPVGGYAYWDSPYWYNTTYVGFRGVAVLPPAYWGHPVFAHPYRW